MTPYGFHRKVAETQSRKVSVFELPLSEGNAVEPLPDDVGASLRLRAFAFIVSVDSSMLANNGPLVVWYNDSSTDISRSNLRLEIQSLGRYRVRDRIGRGTMGIVYRGYDPVLEREIALKTVDLSPGLDAAAREKFLARFFQEARIAAKLLHPNVVVTHDAATDEATGTPFIAMELVSGGSLRDRLEREGRIPWLDACRLVVPLSRALDYAHGEGVVHRDVKPANVLLTAQGVPKIADFGIAKLPGSDLTQTGSVIGTPYYMSPEQLEAGAVDGRSDLFSLGALFYALVSGAPPFAGDDLPSIARQVLYKHPPPLSELVPGVPAALDGVVARSIAKDAGERYSRGNELAEDLERVSRGDAPLGALAIGEKTVESAPRGEAAPERSERSSDVELALAEAPSSQFGWVIALLVASLVGAAWIRWQEVSDFVSARFSEAETTLRESREEAARREAVSRRAAIRLDEGKESFSRGDWDRASAAFDEALHLSRDAQDGDGEATALLWRGKLEGERGEWSKARADFESAAGVFEIYGSASGAAWAIVERADLERDLGLFDQADALYAAAEREASVRWDVVSGRALLGLMRGEFSRAEKGFRAVLTGSPSGGARAQAASILAALEFARGKSEAAEELWRLAEESAGAPGVDLFRGYAALAAGKIDESRSRFEVSAETFRSRGDAPALASALDGLEGRAEESVLATIFLGERRTKRNDERRKRLLAVTPPPEE